MPRKAAAKTDATASADADAAPSSSRRSTRLAEKPAPAAPPPPKQVRKKRPTAEKEHVEEDKKDEPAAKKAKQDEDIDQIEEDEPAPKVEKPASKATKPTSKAAKPSSKASISRAEASSSKAAADKADLPAPIPEEVEEKAKETTTVHDEKPAEEASGELVLGDTLPDWTFKNEKDEDLVVGKLAGEKGVVLFLVPKADTPGCTTQACGFRDIYSDFEKYGYAVYALSKDKSAAQSKWQTKQNLPYSLISDPTQKLISALGAKNGTSTKRSHVIFEKGSGKLVEKKIGVKPVESPKQALDFIKKHHPDVVGEASTS